MAKMRAAVLQKDRSLVVEKVPVPELLPRTAIVKLQAVFVSPFAANVFSGNLLHKFWVFTPSPKSAGVGLDGAHVMNHAVWPVQVCLILGFIKRRLRVSCAIRLRAYKLFMDGRAKLYSCILSTPDVLCVTQPHARSLVRICMAASSKSMVCLQVNTNMPTLTHLSYSGPLASER